ncbi:hypothetical protein SAMN05443639_101382 [Stigmatella erecta]|uniref:Uncharacterized protein n=1 Tax=Stigmatella erecta TaxID=83460 RepID=A0A1H9ZPE3_9BACT|nr:hypothetical protein SAMN05443639_101382 [Stigmatella erecta]
MGCKTLSIDTFITGGFEPTVHAEHPKQDVPLPVSQKEARSPGRPSGQEASPGPRGRRGDYIDAALVVHRVPSGRELSQ